MTTWVQIFLEETSFSNWEPQLVGKLVRYAVLKGRCVPVAFDKVDDVLSIIDNLVRVRFSFISWEVFIWPCLNNKGIFLSVCVCVCVCVHDLHVLHDING